MNRTQISNAAIASDILSHEDLAVIEFVENDDDFHDYWLDDMEEKAFYAAEYDDFCADLDGPRLEANPVSDCGGLVVLLPNGTYLVDRDHTDLELTRAPDTQIYLSARYDWTTNLGGLFVRAATDYESEYSAGGTSNNPKGDTGDFWLMDASTGWTSPDDKWRVQAWCKNCTDKHYTSGLTPTAQFFNQHFWGLPRTYGLTLAYQK